MGIPHLTTHLQGRGVPALLTSRAGLASTVSTDTGAGAGDESSQARSGNSSWVAADALVIDGPGLVFHVYSRLLAHVDTADAAHEYDSNLVDARPTCDEVSVAVAAVLAWLVRAGVKIHAIYFDGALPLWKRGVRLARLQAARDRLDRFYNRSRCGFAVQRPRRPPTIAAEPGGVGQSGGAVDSGCAPQRRTRRMRRTRVVGVPQLFDRQPVAPRWQDVPSPEFLVSTVLEDLRDRWTAAEICRYALPPPPPPPLSSSSSSVTDPPPDPLASWSPDTSIFAPITHIVPDEADPYCAATARTTGAAVLTGDSDLVLHPLGPAGAVIFFDSLEYAEQQGRLRVRLLRPAALAAELRVTDLSRWAFEVWCRPRAGRAEVAARVKSKGGRGKGKGKGKQQKQKGARTGTANDSHAEAEKCVEYREFLQQYAPMDLQNSLSRLSPRPSSSSSPSHTKPGVHPPLSPRLSELYTQYKHSHHFVEPTLPLHLYLPLLLEPTDRRTAWAANSVSSRIRQLAYSLLRLHLGLLGSQEDGSHADAESNSVAEFMRRGNRVLPVPVTLLAPREMAAGLAELLAGLRLVGGVYQLQQKTLYQTEPQRFSSLYASSSSSSLRDPLSPCASSPFSPLEFWTTFALITIFSNNFTTTTNNNNNNNNKNSSKNSNDQNPPAIHPRPTRAQLASFLRHARVNRATLSWYDLYLRAQIQAVFYSLNMLREVLGVVVPAAMTETVIGGAQQTTYGNMSNSNNSSDDDNGIRALAVEWWQRYGSTLPLLRQVDAIRWDDDDDDYNPHDQQQYAEKPRADTGVCTSTSASASARADVVARTVYEVICGGGSNRWEQDWDEDEDGDEF